MASFKIVHQREKCIGCNSCVTIAPQNWTMDKKEGKAELVGSRRKGGVYVADMFDCDLDDNKKAAKACPMNIIKIENQ